MSNENLENEVWIIASHAAQLYSALGVLNPSLSEQEQFKKAMEKIRSQQDQLIAMAVKIEELDTEITSLLNDNDSLCERVSCLEQDMAGEDW